MFDSPMEIIEKATDYETQILETFRNVSDFKVTRFLRASFMTAFVCCHQIKKRCERLVSSHVFAASCAHDELPTRNMLEDGLQRGTHTNLFGRAAFVYILVVVPELFRPSVSAARPPSLPLSALAPRSTERPHLL